MELDRLAQRLGPPEHSGLFSLRGIKLFMDGALGSRGAALEQPYSDDGQNRGLLLTSPDHIEMMARWALVHGYQLATHAIGDRAVNLVLDAYRRAGVTAERNARFRVEHVQVVSEEVVSQRAFQSLGVIASMQPQHAPSDAPWATQRLGTDRIKLAYAWRALLDSGAHLAGGSDFPVEEADPRLALDAALWKTQAAKPGSRPPVDALSVGESVRLLTSDAAYAAFAEDRLGNFVLLQLHPQFPLLGIGGEAHGERDRPNDLWRDRLPTPEPDPGLPDDRGLNLYTAAPRTSSGVPFPLTIFVNTCRIAPRAYFSLYSPFPGPCRDC